VWPGYQPRLVSFRESTHHTIGHRLKSSPHALIHHTSSHSSLSPTLTESSVTPSVCGQEQGCWVISVLLNALRPSQRAEIASTALPLPGNCSC
jgi:hypothetical protein